MSTKSISPKSRFLSHSHQLCFLKRMDEIPQRTFEEIVEKYVEMNISHPFREGNDRDIRLWLDYILKNQIQKVVDWNKIDKEDYLLAMQRSPIRDIEIKHVLRDALISEIYNREIYMKGLVQVTIMKDI